VAGLVAEDGVLGAGAQSRPVAALQAGEKFLAVLRVRQAVVVAEA